jgi:protein-S-isoprenylcysteine O-methyltransferase Ste14
MMDLIGKTTINPFLFYSGKILGYTTWIILLLSMLEINVLESNSCKFNTYFSYLALIVGLIFIVFSIINLGRSTRLGLPSEETAFKKSGLYKFSRNPMYLGFNLLTISSMVYTLNLWIILMGLYSMVIYHLIILGEEKFLEGRFSFEYKSYKTKVRRYL